MGSIIGSELSIPNQDFTQEALLLFDIIRQKLNELRIEANEAREYFRQLIEKVEEIGFIPPLIINLLRDVDNNYQTLIISRNLNAEEEEIIAACIKPMITGTNEVVPQTKSKAISRRAPEELASINDFTNPFFGISEEIYNEVLKCTKGNEKLAQEFSKKAMAALKKISMVPPVLAVNSMPQISMAIDRKSVV